MKKELQNYKSCIGCGADYNLEYEISKCEICGCKKFIAKTTYERKDLKKERKK